MFNNKRISVIIPVYNESKLIESTLNNLPAFIDEIIVIDDASNDNSYEKIISRQDNRTILIKHNKNRGVGGAIISGYKKFIENNNDIAVVMAGDNQMDPHDLPGLLKPLCNNKYDYIKGNRLYSKESFNKIPKVRSFGNSILTLLTKIASGYWHLVDFQCGYTAIQNTTLKKLNLDKIYPKYGFPNDILI